MVYHFIAHFGAGLLHKAWAILTDMNVKNLSPRAKIFADAVTPTPDDMPLSYLMSQFNEQRVQISLQGPSTPQHGIERIVELKIRRWMKDNEDLPKKKP